MFIYFKISIQHLFRFDSLNAKRALNAIYISIQHLFRFDMKPKNSLTNTLEISIQHLFRFDYFKCYNLSLYLLFQYNICFGSTKVVYYYFKGSFISIQHLFRFDPLFGYWFNIVSFISIQHLFRFDIFESFTIWYIF